MTGSLRWTHFAVCGIVLTALYLMFSSHYTVAPISHMLSHWSEDVPSTPSYMDIDLPPIVSASPVETMSKPIKPARRKANAVFVILVRNSELLAIMNSMKQMEDRFNNWAGYDYVFFNDEEFSEDFKKHTSALTDSKCHYGLIESSDWNAPAWIDEGKAAATREQMLADGVAYGGSQSYRNMCRFNSGRFYHHPLVKQYDYYWRVEPGVDFFCDLSYDPFLMMQDEGKVYGFTITLTEYPKTVATLWQETRSKSIRSVAHTADFIKENPHLVAADNAADFLSDDGGESYNMCHFWSNFEIGDLNFWRSEPYSKYFDHLDRAGGFYYERWGDAPVHSIGAALFAKREQIHYFDDIGYRHDPFQHCPQGEQHGRNKCWCHVDNNFDNHPQSCLTKWHDSAPNRKESFEEMIDKRLSE